MALTFDFGATGGRPLKIVNWLAAQSVPASVFVTGVVAQSAIGARVLGVIRDHRELFDVGNHSWDHPDLTKLDDAAVALQLSRTEDVLVPLTGGSTRPVFRPPYGAWDTGLLAAVGSAGWALSVTWDVVTTDYLAPSQGGPTVDELVAQVLASARGGSIVILHLGGSVTPDALPAIVTGLRAAGLEPVTLRHLLRID